MTPRQRQDPDTRPPPSSRSAGERSARWCGWRTPGSDPQTHPPLSTRSSVTVFSTPRAFSNFPVPSLSEMSMASFRASEESLPSSPTTSIVSFSQSTNAASNSPHSFFSTSEAAMALYLPQRSFACWMFSVWSLRMATASSDACRRNMRLRSATRACCMSRSASTTKSTAGRFSRLATWNAEAAHRKLERFQNPATPARTTMTMNATVIFVRIFRSLTMRIGITSLSG